MCEELMPDLFRIEIPLPESPLKYLNSYIIKSPERNLIIDTGLNRKECLTVMQNGLCKLGVELDESDIFITHLHADHFGLVAELASDSTRILFSRPDAELMESWEGFGSMIAYAGENGFPEHELRSLLDSHPGAKYGSDWIPELMILDDGEAICVGRYRFQCVATPGHTTGHTCLYEPDHKLLIAGDHILLDITPNIQCWSDGQNPLKYYLASLEKVDRLEIGLVLPGHRRLIEDYRTRIKELKYHHVQRLEEVLAILDDQWLNAFQVASRMVWDIKIESWDQFPLAQKWFATGEALSHLIYLEEERKVIRKVKNEIVLFTKTS